jgi:hypothetical protein
MPVSSSDAIFLGNFADADPHESNFSAENTSVYTGVFGSSGSPLHEEVVTVTYDDANSSGTIELDHDFGASEHIRYDVGGGHVTAVVDSLVVVELTVTYTNGSSQAFSNAVMYQDTQGNLFLTNSNFAGTNLNGPDNLPIESINVTAVTGSTYTGLFQNALQSFVCFVAGTKILTPAGEAPVETLRVGDMLITEDHGARPIRWVGDSTVRWSRNMRPVRIRAGALGHGLPRRDLRVSQQHRLLIDSPIVQRMTEDREVLIAAKKLVGLPGIELEEGRGTVRYLHVLMDAHEVIFAEGAPTESLMPGPQAMKMMDDEARAELQAIFPDLLDTPLTPARPILTGPRRNRLVGRHLKNGKTVLA